MKYSENYKLLAAALAPLLGAGTANAAIHPPFSLQHDALNHRTQKTNS